MSQRGGLILFGVVLAGTSLNDLRAGAVVNYDRDVRPILSQNCFVCHGRDERDRKAHLRLDHRQGAIQDRKGHVAIVPGNRGRSEVYSRITAADPDDIMPPADSGHRLTAREIDLLGRWIDQGAPYARHWSFEGPIRPRLPRVARTAWARGPIDLFVLAGLERAGLEPSGEADRYRLLRRLSLDLTGLPPSLEEAEAFASAGGEGAYEAEVDRLLASPAYGEHWASMWLDLARFADSSGYGSDPLRPMWRYRDWVIEAFNRNLPYDRFSLEQLAGDLLPNPTLEQRIATAFHRNTKTNTEGGTDDEEFRVEAVKDRVNTTMEVWMGLTMRCATCHSHKYDPITQEEYYRFFAFFNETADADRPDERPKIRTPTRVQAWKLALLDRQIREAKRALNERTPERGEEQRRWEVTVEAALDACPPEWGPWYVAGPFSGGDLDRAYRKVFPPERSIDLAQTFAGGKIRWEARPDLVDGEIGQWAGENSVTYLYRVIESSQIQQVDLSLGSDDGIKAWLNGEEVLAKNVTRAVAPDQERLSLRLRAGRNGFLVKIVNGKGDAGFYFQVVHTGLPLEILSILAKEEGARTVRERRRLGRYFRETAPLLRAERDRLAGLTTERAEVERRLPYTPVMQELEPGKRRKSYVLKGGNFLAKQKEVEPGVPAAFHPFSAGAPKNRLGLAYWLVARDNPMTARVMVNRVWARIFGAGLVETEEDFGTQGDYPSYPGLLDWLAVEFMDRGWDLKALIRTIVTAATYRQRSNVTRDRLEKDPRNRLLSRGPRVRLDAEVVRDQALALSGLLSRKMLGPSVFPPQPEGLWRAAFNGQRKWPTSQGEDRYRRGVYTFIRRTVPYPSMAAFDAPSREICVVRRFRTNTPLQVFVTLNDPAFIEMARALAFRLVKEGGEGVEDRIRFGLRLCLLRRPMGEEVTALGKLFRAEREAFQRDPAAAEALLAGSLGDLPAGVEKGAMGAWVVVGNVLLNLDAVLTKE